MFSVISNMVTGVVGPALEKYFDFKGKEQEKTIKLEEFKTMQKKIEAELKVKLEQEMKRPDSEFRKFVLDYEGNAKDMPRVIQIMRSSVRPVVTYWSLGLISWIMLSGEAGNQIGQNMKGIPAELWWIFLAVFGFWFGGRALENLQNAKQKGQLEQVREESISKVHQERERTRQEEAKIEAERERTRQAAVGAPGASVPPAPAYAREPQPKWDPWKEFDLD